MEIRKEIPRALTQEGIASAVGIQREELGELLRKMVHEGSLAEKKALVEGMKRRIVAYHLTSKGFDMAEELKNTLRGKRIPIRIGRVVRRMTLEEIDNITSIHLSLSDIAREAAKVDIVSIRELENIEKRRKREMERTLRRIKDYTRAMIAAWQDGKMTATERLLMNELRRHLQVTEDEHKRIESEVMGTLHDRPLRSVEIYENIVREALKDGKISSDERAILTLLQRDMGISSKLAAQIEGTILKEK